jgi:[protein-PII] uridylyltransferase
MKWIVSPSQFATVADAETIKEAISQALIDASDLKERISRRIADYANIPSIPVPSPIVETFMDAATDATIVEVRSHDRPALLFGIGDVITKSQVDIRSAIVTTLGAEAIDTLYVTEIGGGALSADRAHDLAARLTAALA